MTTVIGPGAEARAEAIGARAERVRNWLAGQLDAPFSFDSQVRPDLNEDSREAMHRVHGNPPVLEAFADLGTVGYLASDEPDELPVHMTLMRAGCDVPPARFPHSAAMDIASGFEAGGFANDVWDRWHLSVPAERLWKARGVEALRALQGEIDVAAAAEGNCP